jgi:hypothetical protein
VIRALSRQNAKMQDDPNDAPRSSDASTSGPVRLVVWRGNFIAGAPLGRGANPHEIFTDTRGRRYVRDSSGIIHRAPGL